MQLKYREAVKRPKKNIFNVNGGEWKNKTGSGVMNIKNLEQYATDNLVRIAAMYPNPLIPDVKTYYLSWDTSKFNIAVWEIDDKGMVVADFGWKTTATSYTMKSNTVAFTVVVSNKANSNISISEAKNLKLQVEPGTTATSYEDYQIRNSVANKNSKNLLKKLKSYQTTSGSTLNSASHTNYVSDEDNDVIVKTTTAWAGYYNYLDYLDLNYYRGRRMTLSFTVGEQTMGGESAGQISILVRPPNGVEAYATSLYIKPSRIGFREELSFVVPIDTTYMRIAIRNTGNVADAIHVKNLQLEEGQTATEFGTYQITSEKAQLVPKKNYLLPFTKWVADNPVNVSVNFLEQTDRRLVVELNNTNAYAGVSMPIDLSVLNGLKGKTVTFSAKKIVRSQSNSQVQLRFYGGASGNTEFVLSGVGAMSITKTIPTDFTNAFMRVQNNQAGYLQIEVEDLQLEINSVQTPYEGYELAPKQTSYPIKAPYRNYPFTFTRQSVESLSSVQYGMNNPRIKNNGIFMEEGTVNSFSSNGVNDLSTWSAQQVTVSGNLFTENTASAIHRVTRAVSGVSGNQYTLSVLLKGNGRRYVYFNADAVMSAKSTIDLQTGEVVVGKGTASSQYVGDGWYRFSITGTWGSGSMIFLQLNNNFVATDTTHVGNGLSGVYAKDFQFEQKAYPTSYTPKERKNELLYLPSTTSVIDYTKGSIAVDFSYEDVALAMTQTNFMFDSSGTRIFANYDKNLSKFQVSFQGLALLQAPPSVMQNNNKLLVEWDNKTIAANINGYVMSYTNPNTSLITGIGLMSIGVRFSLNQNWINGTINSFVVKDRNDNITFQI
ncbi:hypothetical protein ACFX4N_23635 [Priestia sp. YIM B13551]|uniref:phage head spike fiber domain-containing protein n=1 Tax=Priestia sp. YIM B13551 TaxID=3366306 RepID=UPI00367016DB